MKKAVQIFCIGILLSGMTPVMTQAAVWYVNDNATTGDVFTTGTGSDANPGTNTAPFATIQFAINTAAAGDTIYVDAGTYVAPITQISKNGIVLRGAKFGIPAGPSANPANRGTDESIVQGGIYFGQSRDNISVDGFTINIGTDLRGIEARGLNSTIINNIVTGTANPLTQQAGISTRANAPLRTHSYLIRNNHVTNLRFGIYFDGNLENPSLISYNYVANCFTTGYVVTGSNGHTYRGNVSENNLTGMTIQRGNLTIIENTIRGSSFIGIRIVGTANSFGINIVNNFIQNNNSGISLTDDNAGAINNQANFNSFTGNVNNIANGHAANFNASCNWYETADPALIATTIAGPVTYVPFLTDGIDSDPGTDGFQPTTSCIVVPVILTLFTGLVNQQSAWLSWETASEQNSSHFIIERSLNQVDFEDIGRIQASGYSQQPVTYRFTDSKPGLDGKTVFYRIRMVDLDGSYDYSRIIRLTFDPSASYVKQVFPNPAIAEQTMSITYYANQSEPVEIRLISSTGQTLSRARFQAWEGNNVFNLKVPGTAAGTVFVQIFGPGGLSEKIPVLITK